MFRATDYADPMNTDPTEPSDNPIFLGAGFRQQETNGVTFLNPGDDRVSFIGDLYDFTDAHMYSQRLPADQDAVGDAVNGGVVFGGFTPSQNTVRDANVPSDPNNPGGTVLQSPESPNWYDTLRPNAGFPLPVMSDKDYAYLTGDTMGEPWGVTDPLLVESGVRYVEEKPLDYASRLSTQPSTEQAVPVGWDTALGMNEWTGDKAAMARPIADSGPFFTTSLESRLPSNTGAGGSMVSEDAFNLYPRPLTFRAPPTPWDQGVNSDNGYYVDSGD